MSRAVVAQLVECLTKLASIKSSRVQIPTRLATIVAIPKAIFDSVNDRWTDRKLLRID